MSQINDADDPIELFASWFEAAGRSEPDLPEGVALATASPEGSPSVRMVLLKGFDERGFKFYTNLESRKSRELAANPAAALCFHWKSLQRQVRIEGRVGPVTAEEADGYFASRARDSQIGAWASDQSRPLPDRETLEARIAARAAQYPGSVPRPPHWSGYRLAPSRIEFWQERPHRLHDRIEFSREGSGWRRQRLYP